MGPVREVGGDVDRDYRSRTAVRFGSQVCWLDADSKDKGLLVSNDLTSAGETNAGEWLAPVPPKDGDEADRDNVESGCIMIAGQHGDLPAGSLECRGDMLNPVAMNDAQQNCRKEGYSFCVRPPR